jgi:methionine-rich copper-binding protein CopC
VTTPTAASGKHQQRWRAETAPPGEPREARGPSLNRPRPGRRTRPLPTQVSLTFGEPVQLPPGGLRVFDPDGVQVDDGHTSHPSGRGDVVQIGVRPEAEQGSYTVAWRVISTDTHPVSGAFTFSVGHPSATPAATEGRHGPGSTC